MAEVRVVGSERASVVGALVDLTRIMYLGPAVLSLFLLGALVAMPEGPM